jgi:hypothetical protein
MGAFCFRSSRAVILLLVMTEQGPAQYDENQDLREATIPGFL